MLNSSPFDRGRSDNKNAGCPPRRGVAVLPPQAPPPPWRSLFLVLLQVAEASRGEGQRGENGKWQSRGLGAGPSVRVLLYGL